MRSNDYRAASVSVRSCEKFGQPLRHRRGSEARRNAINRLQSRECERAVAPTIFSKLLTVLPRRLSARSYASLRNLPPRCALLRRTHPSKTAHLHRVLPRKARTHSRTTPGFQATAAAVRRRSRMAQPIVRLTTLLRNFSNRSHRFFWNR